jgi:uncharacterized protein (DUF58 family)
MSGIKLMLLAVVVGALATMSGQSVLYHLTDVLVATVIISALMSWFSVRGIRLDRTLRADRAQVGGTVDQRLELRSLVPLPRVWLEVVDGGTLPGTHPGRVIDLGLGGRRVWTSDTLCRRRGLYQLGPAWVSGSDPFGLFHVARRVGPVRTVLVYPATVDLEGFTMSAGQFLGGDRRRSGWHQTSPFVAGVRDYAPGDPVRHVHWRSTARAGRLMVKEFDSEPVADLWIFLDLDAEVQRGFEDESTEEYGVTVAASIAKHFLGQGRSVGFVGIGAERVVVQPDRGQRQLTKLLEELAVVRADGNVSIAEVIASEGDRCTRNAGLLVISPSLDDRWPGVLRQFGDRGLAAAAIVLEASTFGDAEPSLLLVGVLASCGVPCTLIKRNDDLGQVLTAGASAGRGRRG